MPTPPLPIRRMLALGVDMVFFCWLVILCVCMYVYRRGLEIQGQFGGEGDVQLHLQLKCGEISQAYFSG